MQAGLSWCHGLAPYLMGKQNDTNAVVNRNEKVFEALCEDHPFLTGMKSSRPLIHRGVLRSLHLLIFDHDREPCPVRIGVWAERDDITNPLLCLATTALYSWDGLDSSSGSNMILCIQCSFCAWFQLWWFYHWLVYAPCRFSEELIASNRVHWHGRLNIEHRADLPCCFVPCCCVEIVILIIRIYKSRSEHWSCISVKHGTLHCGGISVRPCILHRSSTSIIACTHGSFASVCRLKVVVHLTRSCLSSMVG